MLAPIISGTAEFVSGISGTSMLSLIVPFCAAGTCLLGVINPSLIFSQATVEEVPVFIERMDKCMQL